MSEHADESRRNSPNILKGGSPNGSPRKIMGHSSSLLSKSHDKKPDIGGHMALKKL
jgi:hypothetical protein